ncbi:unnamed protein product [Nippostrongylus brasiliensis]|uniref:Transmembrane protein n=1 Tax=Nippostrongylus brasiliensis TaxID=27835 RepID=A0A0N4YKT8_NIPBR|nr:unnamed protein product [Nippostrongylus brasiliensis]
MTYGSKCPEPFMSESLRKIVIVETLFICIVSFFAQLAMLRATKRLSGWKSDFSFTIMIFMSAVAIQLYFGEIISHIRFALAVDTDLIDKILGAAFMTSFLTDVLLSITMIFHRVAYTFYPFAAPRVLNSTVLKTYLCMIGLFHLAMLGILISPLTGFIFCPKSLARFIEDDGVATPGLRW